MMKIFDESVELNHNPNWPYIPNHPYQIIIIGGQDQAKLTCYWYCKMMFFLFVFRLFF